jgi:hypothetical protein
MFKSFLLSLLLSSITFAQTYVRPSKGVAFDPFEKDLNGLAGCPGYGQATNVWPNFPIWPKNNPQNTDVSVCSVAYDWTAFSGLQITVNQVDSSSEVKLNVTGVRQYVKFHLSTGGAPGFLRLIVLDSATVNGPYRLAVSVNEGAESSFPTSKQMNANQYTAFSAGKKLIVSVTPVPFAYSPVVILNNAATNTLGSGGDMLRTEAAPFRCQSITRAQVQLTNANPVVVLNQASATAWSKVCNMPFNFYGILRCSESAMETTPQWFQDGTQLRPGECHLYPKRTATTVYCAGNVGDWVQTEICSLP